MIFDFILSAFWNFLDLIIFRWLPVLDSTEALPGQDVIDLIFAQGGYFLYWVNLFIALDTLFFLLQATFVIELAVASYRIAEWLYDKVRGSG